MPKILQDSLAPYAAIFGIGYMGYMLMPAILSVLIDRFGISASDAGMAATLLLGSLAITMFVCVPRLHKVDVLKLARIGTALAVLAYLAAAFAPSFTLTLVCLCLAGAGMGAAISGGDALVSAAPNPDQLFAGIFAVGQLSAFLLLIAVIPGAAAQLEGSGVFVALAIWSLIMLALLFTGKHERDTSSFVHSGGSALIYFSPIVLALFAIGFSDSSVWPFTGEVGASLGLKGGEAEAIQGFALIAGIVGAVLAALVGTRFGRRMPLIAGLAILALMYFTILNATSATVYAAAQITALLVYGFSIPFLFGICSELDNSGRTMAAATGMQMVGLAVAPWVAGSIISATGRGTLGGVVVLSCLLTLALGLAGTRKTRKAQA